MYISLLHYRLSSSKSRSKNGYQWQVAKSKLRFTGALRRWTDKLRANQNAKDQLNELVQQMAQEPYLSQKTFRMLSKTIRRAVRVSKRHGWWRSVTHWYERSMRPFMGHIRYRFWHFLVKTTKIEPISMKSKEFPDIARIKCKMIP
jgi:hypothetical protein